MRHRLDGNGLSVAFTVILKDASKFNQKMAENDAVKFLIKYIGEQYCLYKFLKIFYIDQYGGDITMYNGKVSDIILTDLTNYLITEKAKP